MGSKSGRGIHSLHIQGSAFIVFSPTGFNLTYITPQGEGSGLPTAVCNGSEAA